jgi:hypothetical protein
MKTPNGPLPAQTADAAGLKFRVLARRTADDLHHASQHLKGTGTFEGLFRPLNAGADAAARASLPHAWGYKRSWTAVL